MEDKITIMVADTSTELIPSSWRGLSMWSNWQRRVLWARGAFGEGKYESI